MPLKATPRIAKLYLFFAVLLLALPSISKLYNGYEGKFIVATASAHDPFFAKTVVYIAKHGPGGAFGVIINLPEEGKMYPWKVIPHNGGPVQKGNAEFLLLKDEKALNGIRLESVDNLRKHDPAFIRSLDSSENQEAYKLYNGYAGWFSFQLEREVRNNGWAVIDYDPRLMFEIPAGKIWDEAMKKALEKTPYFAGQL